LLKEAAVIRHSHSVRAFVLLGPVLVLTIGVLPVQAQQPSQESVPQPPAERAQPPSQQDEASLRLVEPDFVVINLPTTMPLPIHGSDFHLTHRFNLDLTSVSFSEAAANLFGLDNGANVGLEYRFGVVRHLQAIVLRTSIQKTFQFSAKYDGWRQGDRLPIGISAIVSIEGQNNFKRDYSPALGLVLSRDFGDRVAFYATPFWVHNTDFSGTGTRDTGFIGVGGRLRVLQATYVSAEVTPRIGGYVPSGSYAVYGYAIEQRVGGHLFSLTFTGGTSTTYAQLAQGGTKGLFLGFNLSRKFF
jgi:hypothetical protein